VNGRIFIIVIMLALLVGGGFAAFVLLRDRTPPSAASSSSSPTSGEPATPRTETTTPAAPPETTPNAPRRPRRESTSRSAEAPAAPVASAPELGTLRIEADVPNAQVFIDRQFIGTAPVTAENVKPGTHTVNVAAEGFESVAQTIDVEPGPREVTIRLREVRLNSMLAVVHKHRIGSCKGQLVATPQGIRYDTDNRDDRFTAALADLDTFIVDYQEKNLKIKLRKGKEYNFTDPDGNADRLFVFHRDVDKARQRLNKGDVPASN
jgi:hypothetical protein